MCDGRNHPLCEIFRTKDAYEIYSVVNWCPDCGAVVVDGEHDGRVAPGRVMPMRFPRIRTESNKGDHHE
jgi:ribosomal protein S27AE